MAKHDEISSTEKLLDVIRGKGEKTPDDPSEVQPSPAPSKSIPASLIKKLPFKRKVTVGVDIGLNDLKLVAIGRTGDKPELLDYTCRPYEPDIKKNSPQFPRFLRSALTDFCGSSKNVEIWSFISSAQVETRYIRIPKVASRQISNAVYWTYKKEVSFNDNNDIFDYEILGDVVEEGVRRQEVIAYSAPKKEVQELKNIVLKTGYHLTGISIVPFALQNFLRNKWLATDAKNICNLFIGSDWSRIAIFSEGYLILSRDIKSGVQSMVESIREQIGSAQANPSEEGFDEEIDSIEMGVEKPSYYDIDAAQKIFNQFIQEPAPNGNETHLETIKEDPFSMIVPALERIVRQVERTLQHYALNYKNEAIEKIFISGETSTNRAIINYIGSQLELPLEVIDPFGDEASLSDPVRIPESEAERGSYVPAIGIALSSNELTPNFIHTYKDKEETATAARFNKAVLGGVFLLIAICFGAYYWQGRIIKLKNIQRDQLQRRVDRFIPYVDENLILQMATQVQENRLTLEQYGRKYMGMALIGVVSTRTPANIRLLSMKADFGQISEKKGQDIKKNLILEGIVFGDRLAFESSLADYLVQLKKTPLFSRASVQNKSIDLFEDREVMKFTAQLDLI